MKINYIKNRIKHNLLFGILMMILGLFAIYEDMLSVFSYLWVLIGVLQLISTLNEKKHQYLSIENNKLTRHSIFPKTIEISDIRKIRKSKNSYKIETSERTLKIDKNIIEAESLYKLEDYFNSLDLKA